MTTERAFTASLTALVFAIVLAVTALSFVLSYEALVHVAQNGGKTGVLLGLPLSYVWPLIIDLPVIGFSLVALFAIVQRRHWAWFVVFNVLVLASTAVTVWFNWAYAAGTGFDPAVYVMAPVMYFITFEVFIWLVKVVSERAIAAESLGQIQARISQLRADHVTESDKLQAALDNLSQDLADKRARLADIETEIQDRQVRLRQAGRQPVILLGTDPDGLKGNPAQRQIYLGQMIRQMRSMGIDESDIQETAVQTFSISDKTYQRDIADLNGSLK